MEKLFEDLSSPGTFTAETEETDREFKVTFDLPGVKKDDVHVEVVGNQLRISGERKEEKEVKDRSFYHSERFYGLFERSFSLPKNVKIDEISADFKDGVLKIAIPKSEIPKTPSGEDRRKQVHEGRVAARRLHSRPLGGNAS